jgi:hypothetical protein
VDQPRQIDLNTFSEKILHKKGLVELLITPQGRNPEIKAQYQKKERKKLELESQLKNQSIKLPTITSF